MLSVFPVLLIYTAYMYSAFLKSKQNKQQQIKQECQTVLSIVYVEYMIIIQV